MNKLWGFARGGPMSPVWILKRLVSVFINACRLLSALPSLSQFGQGRLSLGAISFYALSLPFGPCRLSEFTLAGPQLLLLLKIDTTNHIEIHLACECHHLSSQVARSEKRLLSSQANGEMVNMFLWQRWWPILFKEVESFEKRMVSVKCSEI